MFFPGRAPVIFFTVYDPETTGSQLRRHWMSLFTEEYKIAKPHFCVTIARGEGRCLVK